MRCLVEGLACQALRSEENMRSRLKALGVTSPIPEVAPRHAIISILVGPHTLLLLSGFLHKGVSEGHSRTTTGSPVSILNMTLLSFIWAVAQGAFGFAVETTNGS